MFHILEKKVMWKDACFPIFLKVRQIVNWENSAFQDQKYNIGDKKVN